jgi:hypothetical protein
MTTPRPSSTLLNARRILRDDAVAQTERRLGVDPEVMPAVAGLASDQLVVALDGVDVRHAGWGMLATGISLVRRSERIPGALAPGPDGAVTAEASSSAAAGPSRADASPSLTGALAWSALLAAVVGDRLLDCERPVASDWAPGELALTARPIGRKLAGRTDAASFVADLLDELDRELPQLEPGPAGWALLVTGVWIGANDERLVTPLVRRRLLARRVVKDADQARAGCDLAASLLCGVGEVLIARAASIASTSAADSGRDSR